MNKSPVTDNDGGFEKKVGTPAHLALDKTAGNNVLSAAYAFEQRVVQETGTH